MTPQSVAQTRLSAQKLHFAIRLRIAAEVAIWALVIGGVLFFGWQAALTEYWIDLTPRATLACDHDIGSLAVDRSTPAGLLGPEGATGGSVVVEGVTGYAVAGSFVIGASRTGWFVLDTKNLDQTWPDMHLFIAEPPWHAHLKQRGIAAPPLRRPAFRDARLSSVGVPARIALIFAAALMLAAILRVRSLIVNYQRTKQLRFSYVDRVPDSQV